MKNAVFLPLSLIFFNFGFLPNSSGKFILVEVDQKQDAIAKSGPGNIYLIIKPLEEIYSWQFVSYSFL